MGDKYTVLIAKYPYKGYYENIQGFDTFKEAVEFAEKSMKRGYDIVDIKCRDIKEKGV